MAGPSALGTACRQSTRLPRAPSEIAAATYGCARTPSTSARIIRATPIHPVAMSTMTTVPRPGCQSAAHTSSSTSRGIDSIASVAAINTRSTAPPLHAATAPTAVPSAAAATDPTTPTISEMRPASIIRTNRSRPNRSVPNRCNAPDPSRANGGR